jgi:hypothetical protein
MIEVVMKDRILVREIIKNAEDIIIVEDANGKERIIPKDKILQVNMVIEKRTPIVI